MTFGAHCLTHPEQCHSTSCSPYGLANCSCPNATAPLAAHANHSLPHHAPVVPSSCARSKVEALLDRANGQPPAVKEIADRFEQMGYNSWAYRVVVSAGACAEAARWPYSKGAAVASTVSVVHVAHGDCRRR